jgi:DNA-binding response OmpR family regulator
MNIVLADRDAPFRRTLRRRLESEGHKVRETSTTCTSLEAVHHSSAAAMIVDWHLLDGGARALCRAAKASQVPAFVLVLAAHESRVDRLAALAAGADDFLVKPFVDMREILARLWVRERVQAGPRAARLYELRHDPVMRRLSGNGAEVELTPTESALFARLQRGHQRVVPWGELASCLRTHGKASDRQELAVYMATLRRKLRPVDLRIANTRGVGYALFGPARD